MAFCNFCRARSNKKLKSCVCKKVSYCSKECQVKDWKVHKPSCPPYIIKETPGKGRGLFATRRIKEGQLILEEYPLIALREGFCLKDFEATHFPGIDEETKAKILQLNDPADDIKKLDTGTVKKLISKNPIMRIHLETEADDISKMFRIIAGNSGQICMEADLYDTTEGGLYNNISLINHACVPNATLSWVMGDFKKKQLRAMMVIEKDQEILIGYGIKDNEFFSWSRELRRQQLLETRFFLCQCSECSLEGEDLEDNDRMRAEVMEKTEEIQKVIDRTESDPRKNLKKAMKLSQKKTNLVQTLNIRAGVMPAMIDFYGAATRARMFGVHCENDPDIYKQEALKYAKMFGDQSLHFYNNRVKN